MVPDNVLMVEEIITGFPNPALPKIDHEPTFEDIKITTRLLNANAISVPSLAGGGAHGHLGITMTQLEYYVISAAPWAEPYNPGPIPVIADGTNAVDDAQLARLRDEFRRIQTNHINLDQALKCIILEEYDNMYASLLEDYLLQYANRSELEILMHLKTAIWFHQPHPSF
jgi:hypothetical protein